MKINGVDYPVIGKVKIEKLGKAVPVLDISMLSDERWNELVAEQRAKHGDFYKAKALE
ncbi:MAG: hypothetical protein ACLS9O_15770 [Hungatella sp.]|uniref:hypothetical protein n=1 Tax=Hungatella sp. TaxID=2613924 RepID=UPI0039964A78